MQLEEISVFFEKQSKTNSTPVSEISRGSFSADGDFYAVGMENGRIIVFPVCVDGSFLPPGRLKVGVSFVNTDRKFDSFRCEAIDDAVRGLDFCHGKRLNPLLLSCNSAFCNLHEVTCDEVCEFEKISSVDQFVVPRVVSKTRSLSVKTTNEYCDSFLNCLVDVKCRNDSFLVAAYNGVDLFDFEKKLYSRSVCLDESSPEISSLAVNGPFDDIFGVGRDNGTFNCYDLRQQPQCLSGSFTIDTTSSIPKERVSPVNSCCFSDSGEFLAIRTFGDVFVYDVRNVETPSYHFNVQWFPKISDWIRDSGMINDTFGLAFVDDTRLATGCYSGEMVILDIQDNIHSKHTMKLSKGPNQFNDSVRDIRVHPAENVITVCESERLHFQRICE